MEWVIYESATGEIVKTISGSIEGQLETGQSAASGTGSWMTHTVVGGILTKLSAPRVAPSPAHKWDRSSATWSDPRTLPQAKADAWATIKAERARRLAGTFTHAGNTYDIDPVNISGASIDAREAILAGESLIPGMAWSQMWVLSNNTTVTLTASQMIAVGRDCKVAVSNLWTTSQYLRGLIEAATTAAQAEAITWA